MWKTGVYSAVLWAALFAMGAGAESARFVQEEFAIGLWVDPPLDERADERYRELA